MSDVVSGGPRLPVKNSLLVGLIAVAALFAAAWLITGGPSLSSITARAEDESARRLAVLPRETGTIENPMPVGEPTGEPKEPGAPAPEEGDKPQPTPSSGTTGETGGSTAPGGGSGSVASGGPPGYFIKIDGVSGESTDASHKNEIEVVSWSFGASSSASSTSAGAGAVKAKAKTLSFASKISKASPYLHQYVYSGKNIANATLTARGNGGFDYLKIKLSNVLISSYDAETPEDDLSRPMETVELKYDKIEVEYVPVSAMGAAGSSIKAGWNVLSNKTM
jgi:type VI secretion system secreted protein Hcp